MSRTHRNTYMSYWTTHQREEYAQDPFWLRRRNARGTIHSDRAFNGYDGVMFEGREAFSGAPKGYCNWNSCGSSSKAVYRRMAWKIIRQRGKQEIREALREIE